MQDLLSSSLLSKNLKIKMYRNIILSVFCMGVKLGHTYCWRDVGREIEGERRGEERRGEESRVQVFMCGNLSKESTWRTQA